MLSLNFENRTIGEEKEGMLKGVFYGLKEKSHPIFVEAIAFSKIYKEAGESSVIELIGDKKIQAMIQDVAYNPVKNTPIHVDFYIVEKGAKIDTSVNLEFVGISEAVKSLGGTLVKVLHEIEIEGDATNLPHNIPVDISSLDTLDSIIKTKDLKLPVGVTLYRMDGEEVVASISVAKEEDLSAPVEGDISTIEVQEKGKKEEDTNTTE
ncbi:MAG: 50S ribosomal protein L25 [Candidatus Pacebacteria bacterium]|nr:50S ribosomal protein L25 [Candidatus Paceibacterota bacterium]